MKLVIQIPCYNEENTLALTLNALPQNIEGVESIEYLIINDGSTDNTPEIAQLNGAHHIVSLPQRQGLAKAFMAGLETAVHLGADIIVNTDGDNQYCADDIEKLITPVLSGQADIAIGRRPVSDIEHFSLWKKALHKIGNIVVRKMSGLNIYDAPSGFRAMSRDAALQLNVFTDFTYTLETLVQAGQKGMTVVAVPVRVNNDLRPSRLMSGMSDYIGKSVLTLLRVFVIYQPFLFFFRLGITLFTIGGLICLRFMYFFLSGSGQGHVQSLILASILLGFGFQSFVVAFIADLLATNRKILEDIQYRVRCWHNPNKK